MLYDVRYMFWHATKWFRRTRLSQADQARINLIYYAAAGISDRIDAALKAPSRAGRPGKPKRK